MNKKLFCFALSLGMPLACYKAAPREVQLLRWLGKADPIADAKRALARGDRSLLAVRGLAAVLPGTDPKDFSRFRETYGIRTIEGTSDCLVNEEHGRLNAKARSYAAAYNRFVLQMTEPQGADRSGGQHGGRP